MIAYPVSSLEMIPASHRCATPAKPPLSSSTVALMSTAPASSTPARRSASTANTAAAIPDFMSDAPRP